MTAQLEPETKLTNKTNPLRPPQLFKISKSWSNLVAGSWWIRIRIWIVKTGVMKDIKTNEIRRLGSASKVSPLGSNRCFRVCVFWTRPFKVWRTETLNSAFKCRLEEDLQESTWLDPLNSLMSHPITRLCDTTLLWAVLKSIQHNGIPMALPRTKGFI